MLLVIHIVIAVSGLVIAAASLLTLSQKMINASYALTVGTIATGTVLVFANGNVLKNCLTGLCYLAAVLVMTAIAKRRLAAVKVDL